MKKRMMLVASIALSLGVAAALYAQQPGFTRKMLQDQDLSVSDRHAVQVVAEFVPAASPASIRIRARNSAT